MSRAVRYFKVSTISNTCRMSRVNTFTRVYFASRCFHGADYGTHGALELLLVAGSFQPDLFSNKICSWER